MHHDPMPVPDFQWTANGLDRAFGVQVPAAYRTDTVTALTTMR